jgi:hypothetical protein
MAHLKKSSSGHLLKNAGGHLVKDCGGGCCAACSGWEGAPSVSDGNVVFPPDWPSWSVERHAAGSYDTLCHHVVAPDGSAIMWYYARSEYVQGPLYGATFFYQLWIHCGCDQSGHPAYTALLGYVGFDLLGVTMCVPEDPGWEELMMGLTPYDPWTDITSQVSCVDGVLTGTFDLPVDGPEWSGHFTVSL